ncbi:MAG: hypothetical protein C0603_02120 [Denitrovibrio sp.]|nr:MAG: hypothetical protein C0603_02120 [Denitrovibrio sp.]
MVEYIASYGYVAMFFLGFLAATVLPLGSEWLLVLLITRELDPILLVLFATLGNYLGACTTYLIGFYGSDVLIEKLLRIDEKKRAKAEFIYNKYGALSLAMSWVPIVGDPLCLIGGLFKYSFTKFSILVSIGKLARYAFLAYITLRSVEIMTK